MTAPLYALTFGAALGCAIVAGVFFAFSTFVMRALRRLPPAHGIVAMQSINTAAINPAFLSALLGTAVPCGVLGIWSLVKQQEPFLLSGSVIYLVGTLAVTIGCHVPRNDVLALLRPEDPEATHTWISYLDGWTAWNHVRAAAASAAAALLILALSID